MKIATATYAAAATVSVPLSATYRFMDIMAAYGFQTVSYWTSRGLAALNSCGQGWQDYNVAMIPVTASFTGTATRIRLTMPVFVSNPKSCTFRWAVCSQRLDYLFMGTGPLAAGNPMVLGQGKFTPEWNHGGIVSQTFVLSGLSALPSTFYVYLWRSTTRYGNIHITGACTVAIDRETAAVTWKNGRPYVYTAGGWKVATPYVFASGAWRSG